ncbi:hypothetical protein EJB05_33730, partial [Eragrostis curvula]
MVATSSWSTTTWPATSRRVLTRSCHCTDVICSFIGTTKQLVDHITGSHSWPCTTKVIIAKETWLRLQDGFNFLVLDRLVDEERATTTSTTEEGEDRAHLRLTCKRRRLGSGTAQGVDGGEVRDGCTGSRAARSRTAARGRGRRGLGRRASTRWRRGPGRRHGVEGGEVRDGARRRGGGEVRDGGTGSRVARSGTACIDEVAARSGTRQPMDLIEGAGDGGGAEGEVTRGAVDLVAVVEKGECGGPSATKLGSPTASWRNRRDFARVPWSDHDGTSLWLSKHFAAMHAWRARCYSDELRRLHGARAVVAACNSQSTVVASEVVVAVPPHRVDVLQPTHLQHMERHVGHGVHVYSGANGAEEVDFAGGAAPLKDVQPGTSSEEALPAPLLEERGGERGSSLQGG